MAQDQCLASFIASAAEIVRDMRHPVEAHLTNYAVNVLKLCLDIVVPHCHAGGYKNQNGERLPRFCVVPRPQSFLGVGYAVYFEDDLLSLQRRRCTDAYVRPYPVEDVRVQASEKNGVRVVGLSYQLHGIVEGPPLAVINEESKSPMFDKSSLANIHEEIVCALTCTGGSPKRRTWAMMRHSMYVISKLRPRRFE